MDSQRILPSTQRPNQPPTALAPMQAVTTLPFMKVIEQLGAPDYFFTEYFRVHEHSTLEKHILESITLNPSKSPVFAQLIGESIPHVVRTIKALKEYPVAGIDLNMGCPAPKVYKKNAGGGLLRDVNKVDSLLGAMRDNIEGLFTVKMRIGFEDTSNFAAILELVNKHEVDLLSLHGRTVKGMYRSEVDYDCIAQAAASVKCPLLANGDITSVKKAQWALDTTGCSGVMIGRSAIRNPWIFRQMREHSAGETIFAPTLSDVYDYIEKLFEATYIPGLPEDRHISRMKKFLNFIGTGVDEEGFFLKAIRRATSKEALFNIAHQYLLEDEYANKPFALEPHPGLVARPNAEA